MKILLLFIFNFMLKFNSFNPPKEMYYVYSVKLIYTVFVHGEFSKEEADTLECDGFSANSYVVFIPSWEWRDLGEHHASGCTRVIPKESCFSTVREAWEAREKLIDSEISFLDNEIRKELYEFK